jgi:lysophospholipase L1-like esterase
MKHLIILLLVAIIAISCHKAAVQAPLQPATFKNVLILGNSITYAPANPSIGWNNSWGMAASIADSDYVHLLTARFKGANKSAVVAAVNIAEFEGDFDNYDFDTNLKSHKDSKPDLIILRIGENVLTTDSVEFEKRYVDLLTYFKANNPNVKILAAASVWPDRDLADKVMSRHSDYISLIGLESDLTNFAFGLFANAGIQSHPDDKGMRLISNMIWTAVGKLKPD